MQPDAVLADAPAPPPPADPQPRRLDRDWRERHIRWQAEGRIPWGKTPLLYEDGTPVFCRNGRPRMWSEHVMRATVRGRKSSRALAKIREKAAEAARIAEAGRALRAQVQRGMKPPPRQLFGVDVAGLIVIGPLGGIGIADRIVRTLEPLAAGGRHPTAALQAAGAWRDEQALAEALAGIGGKLAAIGLRIDRRKVGIRMAKG